MITLSLDMNENFLPQLSLLADALEDTSELMDVWGAVAVDLVQDRFDNEQGPDGQKWTPSYRVKHDGGKTLTDSGHLRDSIQHVASNGSVEIGTNVVYARIHNFGGTIKPKTAKALSFFLPGISANGGPGQVFAKSVTMPKREFLGLNDDDLALLGDMTLDWLNEKMEAA